MNSEEQRAMKDAHTRLAQLPHYAGSVVIFFSRDFKIAQVGSTVPDELAARVLGDFLANLRPPPIIVPASAGLPPPGRKNGSG